MMTKLCLFQRLVKALLVFISFLYPLHSFANQSLEVSGFATWALTKSDNATPWYVNREITDDTCYNCDSIWGVQLDYQALDSVRLSGQVVKRPEDSWNKPEVEWAYAAYSPTDNLDIRIGKLRLPLFLMSDYYYVGNAFPWIRPVPEVYNRQLGITASEGIDFIYNWYISDEYTLTIHPYYGGKKEATIDSIDTIIDIESDYKYGIAFDLSTEKLRLHINYFEVKGTELLYTTKQTSRPISTDTFGIYKNTALGLTYELPFNLEFWAEYQADESKIAESTTQYAALTWHFHNFTPYIIYSEEKIINTSNEPPSNYIQGKKYDVSDTQTLGLKYDLPKNISLNLEYSLSTSHEPPPIDSFSKPPKGVFVTSYWAFNSTTNQWDQIEDNKAHIWTLAINWNF